MAVITYYADTKELEDADLYTRCYERAPAERRGKVDSFHFDKDRRLSIGAWTLLTHALDAAGCDPGNITYGEYGKPDLEGSGVHFNLSHSGERVLCSVSSETVGCDVEKVDRIEMEIAERYFFDSEYESIMGCTGDARYEMFFRFWTLKESFMKAVGLGFNLDLDAFKVTIGDRITVDHSVDDSEYHFREYSVDDGYRYAVCSTDDDFSPRMEKVTFAQCLRGSF